MIIKARKVIAERIETLRLPLGQLQVAAAMMLYQPRTEVISICA
jgi:hypothetical protein